MAVEFEEEQFSQSNQMQRDRHGAVTNLLMKLGLAKSGAQANVVMVIITLVATGLAIYLLLPNKTPTTPMQPLLPGQPSGQMLPR